MKKRNLLLLLTAAALAVSGCRAATAYDSGKPPEAAVEAVSDVGALQFDPLVQCRDGGCSALWQGKSIWLFGDTVTTRPAAGGLNWLSNSMGYLENPAAFPESGLQLKEFGSANPVPAEFIPWTREEQDYNRQNFTAAVPAEQRRRWAIWPAAAVAARDDASLLIFFSLLQCGPNGAWDFRSVGKGVVLQHRLDQPAERPAALLFGENDIQLGDAALRVGDMLYAYGSELQDSVFRVRLGRAPFERAAERDSWEFYCGNGRWSKEAGEARPVMTAAPMLSVHWNAYLKRYLAVYTVPLANRLAIRTAPSPEGPWSAEAVVADCRPTTGEVGCYAGLAHAELAREGGRIEYLSYYRETGFFRGDIRVLKLTFSPPPQQQ